MSRKRYEISDKIVYLEVIHNKHGRFACLSQNQARKLATIDAKEGLWLAGVRLHLSHDGYLCWTIPCYCPLCYVRGGYTSGKVS